MKAKAVHPPKTMSKIDASDVSESENDTDVYVMDSDSMSVIHIDFF